MAAQNHKFNQLFFLCAFLLFSSLQIFAQKPKRIRQLDSLDYRKFFEVKIHEGGHIYTGGTLTEVLKKGYRAIDVKYGLQTTGKNFWDSLYRYPRYGLGAYHADLKNNNVLGNPNAIYGFINVPFYQRSLFSFNYDINLGVSYNFEQYHKETNPLNDAISSDMNVFVGLGLSAQYQVFKHLEFIVGLEYTHFSNGRITTPNHGLNLVGSNWGIRYSCKPFSEYVNKRWARFFLKGKTPRFTKELPEFKPYWEKDIFFAAGRNATYESDLRHFTNISLSFDMIHRYNLKYSLGVGVDMFYDGSLIRHYSDDNVPFKKQLMSGVHIAHNWYFYDFVATIQLATYLHRGTKVRGRYYARLGGQYNFTKHWFGQISLKSQNGTKADFIEWGGGVRIF